MGGLLTTFRYATQLIGAREDIAFGRYERSLARMRKVFSMYGAAGPSSLAPIRANIMLGLAAWNLGQSDLTYHSCRVALDQVEARLPKARPAEQNELRYLRGYCKTLVAFANAGSGFRSPLFADVEALRAPDYDPDRVSASLRRTFPIDDTSWWATGL